MRKFTAEEVAKIKEKYKYAERDFLKNLQAIHGKEEGLKQYNEIMECERHYHKTYKRLDKETRSKLGFSRIGMNNV